MYDKRAAFKKIDEGLNEIRKMCNREQIPFFWIAPVYDDGKGTEYKVALDANKEPKENIQYACNALVPGSMDIDLTQDLIRDMVKVMNGFKVVANDSQITISAESISPEKVFAKTNLIDKDGFLIESAPDLNSVYTKSNAFVDMTKENDECDVFSNLSLPYCEGDYEE